jgi:hypothetical protein
MILVDGLTLASSLLHLVLFHPSSSFLRCPPPSLRFSPRLASRVSNPPLVNRNLVHVCLRLHFASSAGAKALHPLQNPCVLDLVREIAAGCPLTRLSDIRNANDAHRIFEAVRLGLLPLVTRRLTPTERDLLRSGQVFVWEEGSSSGGGAEDGTPSAGLERWTDGRRWYVRTIRVYSPISCPFLSIAEHE